jgi:Rrf2 family protein
MKVSIKCDYALRAIFELALNHGKAVLRTNVIARRQVIPKRYLEQILLSLKKAGLVDSYRGKVGGYVLVKRPEEIRVNEVLEAVEGSLDLLPKRRRRSSRKDVISDVWASVQKSVVDVLRSTTLEDLVIKKRQVDKSYVYNI